MKKIILTSAIAFLGIGAFAQTTPAAPTQKATDMKDLRTDIRDKRQDKRQEAADIKSGNAAAAASAKQNIKAENQNIKADAANAKADGVKHPIKKAQRQIHRQNVRRRG